MDGHFAWTRSSDALLIEIMHQPASYEPGAAGYEHARFGADWRFAKGNLAGIHRVANALKPSMLQFCERLLERSHGALDYRAVVRRRDKARLEL